LLTLRSRAALLRQISPGKARDAGNGIPLPSPATPHGDICRATLRAGPVFVRCGLLVAYLDDQTSLLVPCFAQKQAPARPRPKRQQTLRKTWFFCSSRLLQDARGRACAYLKTRPAGSE